ncbi:hypothetical protein EDC04DRAFT_2610651 [Pisolithus marmoratus]|nr:hypothetical protein EDC04DRAFT_2610651 [Pisolithus marmoratus]
MKWVKVVSMPSPDEIAWFSLASVDPPLVNHMLMRFLAQWWQDGDTRSSDEVVEALEISVHDFKLEFPMGTSIQVIMGLNCGFQGIVIGTVDDIMLHWYSGHKILITPSMLQQADADNLRDKGKSRAQEPEVPGSNGNINEGSDLIQVSVSMDEVLIIPPSTLQFSREKGYDVTIGDCVQVAHVLADDGPLHDVLIGFCIKLENHSLCDIECQVGHEVWIISGPRKGYRGMLQSVGRTYCNVMIKSGIMQLKNTAVITDTTLPMSQSTVDPSAEPGPSTLACSPWVPHSDDITPWPLNEQAQADTDYGCVPWLFDNNFCDYANWHVCLRVAMSYNHGSLLKQVVLTMVPDHLSTVIHGLGLAPPGHVSVTVTSSTVKKCQVKKDLKGVELEDGTKLPLGDVCQVIPTNQPGRCGDYWAGIGCLVPPHHMITSEHMETDF